MNFYGLLGYPLGHSLSPVIHKIIYQTLNIEAAYKLFEVEDHKLGQAVQALKVLDIRGANVTVPYKQKVMPLLNSLDAKAQKLQAVNTIKNVGGQLTGYNTDYDGVLRTFQRHGWPMQDQEVYIMGTGGASQAVAHCLYDKGARIHLVSRQPIDQGDFDQISYADLERAQGQILINTTPVGMVPNIHESPVDAAVVKNFDIIFDITYGKEDNRLLSLAKDQVKDCADGLEMLIGQAIAAVELWEDIEIDDQLMDDILSHFEKE